MKRTLAVRPRSIRAASICAAVILASLAAPLAALAQAPTPTPTESYLAYRKALAGATAYRDLLPFMDAKGRALVESLPEATQSKMFDMMKTFAGTFTEISVSKETVDGAAATLELSGKDPKGQPATGSVPMAKEGTAWKVGAEKWSSAPRRRP